MPGQPARALAAKCGSLLDVPIRRRLSAGFFNNERAETFL